MKQMQMNGHTDTIARFRVTDEDKTIEHLEEFVDSETSDETEADAMREGSDYEKFLADD
mgnify:CR=1 FL=1